MNLHHPSVMVSTHTRASNAIPSQPPRYANDWTSLSTQPIHYFSFPPRPLRTALSRFPNTISFGNRPPPVPTFLHAAMNLHHPSVMVSTHTRASNAIPSQPPRYANDWTSLSTQPIHYFSFPPRPLRTALSRFPNTISFGNRPPPVPISVPAYKSLIKFKAVFILSHLNISMAWLQEVIRRFGLLRCAPMMRSKTQWCTVRSLEAPSCRRIRVLHPYSMNSIALAVTFGSWRRAALSAGRRVHIVAA